MDPSQTIQSLVIDIQPAKGVDPERDTPDPIINAFRDKLSLIRIVNALHEAVEYPDTEASDITRFTTLKHGKQTHVISSDNMLIDFENALADAYAGTGPEFSMKVTLDGETLLQADVLTIEDMAQFQIGLAEVVQELRGYRTERIRDLLNKAETLNQETPMIIDPPLSVQIGALPVQLHDKARELLAEKFGAVQVSTRDQS